MRRHRPGYYEIRTYIAPVESQACQLPPLDAVADTVDGRTAEELIAKVTPGGVLATVLGAPQNAAKYPAVKVAAVFSKVGRKTLEYQGRSGARWQAADPD